MMVNIDELKRLVKEVFVVQGQVDPAIVRLHYHLPAIINEIETLRARVKELEPHAKNQMDS